MTDNTPNQIKTPNRIFAKIKNCILIINNKMNKIKLEKCADREKFKKMTKFIDFFMSFSNI